MKAILAVILVLAVLIMQNCINEEKEMKNNIKKQGEVIKLPEPSMKGEISVEEAIKNRRSRREYRNEPLTLKELSQLLWSAQGITGPAEYYRAAPSAGATDPLELYIVVGNVEEIEAGIYHYNPVENTLILEERGDYRDRLANNALNQEWVRDAAINIVFTAIYERTTNRYGERGIRYVHMEVGHAAQNVYLQAESLGLGTVVVGAFSDQGVKELLNLTEEEPVYIMPVGRI